MFRNLIIFVAVFGLGWGASFGAGMAFGRRSVPAPPVAQAATIALGQGAAAGGQGGAGAAQSGPGGVVRVGGAGGVVERVEGQTLTLRGPNNQQVRVALTDQTQVHKQVEGSTGDLAAGVSVLVQPQGQPGADGVVTAAAVTVLPANAAARPGQGQGGQRPGGAGGAGGQGAQRAGG
jgi:hypothetical protein